jgi:hypothetical protein
LSKGDAVGRQAQGIATELATSTFHDAMALKVKQNLFKKFERDPLLCRDVRNYQARARKS